ncbi:YeeE/YedE family protein [Novosphingobium pentaromativorans]|uniref:YeeE/YedE family protein n=1 Tax=Novosphingobium pentaromativorans US6-1 TaxID=1088721 RepID=G6EBZ0_9SPHN|nr:YeeE/YedE thiosulfate transporter family protein [Novosphingobium pentaromativorans]AIT80219.1 membrane protein [Novosphingobium pentaromativorans US6-1]EHJ61198.1 YeeE/YedE family protein [Novosphingobium pentaromativorans US6-1]
MLSELFPHAQPLHGFIGGILIGLAGAVMLLGAGRIAGVSGLAARTLGLASGAPRMLAALFIAGLPIGALIMATALGGIEARFPPSYAVLAVAGLITGFGTRLGSGCTSGHGVCGLSRLSPRSIVATGSFIASGMVTVALVNALGGGW